MGSFPRSMQFALCVGLLLLVPFFVLKGTLSNDFVRLDDRASVSRFDGWQGSYASRFLDIWGNVYKTQYLPVTSTVYELLRPWAETGTANRPGAEIAELNPTVYHAAGLAFHLMNGVLVFWILYTLTGGISASFLAALIFSLHPAQVESHAWVGAFNVVIASFFFFLAIGFYLQFDRWRRGVAGGYLPDRHLRMSALFYGATSVCFLLAMMAKPTAIVFPVFVFAIGYFHLRLAPKKLLLDITPWIVMVLPLVSTAAYEQRSETLSFQVALADRIWVALDSIAFYSRMLFSMSGRYLDYGRTPGFVMGLSSVYVQGLLVLAALGGVFFAFRKRAPWVLAVVAIFIGGFGPVLGLKPFLFQTVSTVADRYYYLPLLGICFGIAQVLKKLESFRVQHLAAVFVCGVSIIFCARASMRQVDTWKSTVALYENTIRHNPRSWLAFNNLASHHEVREEKEAAIAYYLRSAEIHFRIDPLQRAAIMMLELKQPERAVPVLEQILKDAPGNAIAWSNLAYAYFLMGKTNEAKSFAQKTLEIAPKFGPAENILRDIASSEKKKK